MKKTKTDSPKTIIRLQDAEIKGLMDSRAGWKADAEHYKNKYNEVSAERDALKRQLWRMETVETFLLDELNRSKAAIAGWPKPASE